MDEPKGSSKCDVCGLDTPHGHTEFDVIQQRYARKAFEDRYKKVVTSSWDGDTSSIVPRARGPRPEDGYWGQEDDRRWQTYVSAWLDAWKHFGGRIKELDAEVAGLRIAIRQDAHLVLSQQSRAQSREPDSQADGGVES